MDAYTNKMETVRSFTNVIARLRDVNLRPTRQRIALAKMLFDGDNRHITAEMLYQETQNTNIRVSLATVYNTLNQFTSAGLLREIVVDSQRCYFDTNTTDHHHFFFEKTNELKDIEVGDVVLATVPLAPAGTVIKRIDVVLRVE